MRKGLLDLVVNPSKCKQVFTA